MPGTHRCWDPDHHPQLPGTEHVWLGPPETHSPRGVTLPPSMSKEGGLWDRPSLGPNSTKAGLPSKVFLPAPAHTPLHVSEGGGEEGFQPGASPPPPSPFHLSLVCVWLTSYPSFSLAGEPLSTRPRKHRPAASALSAFTAISKRPGLASRG